MEPAPSVKVARGATYLFLQGIVANLVIIVFIFFAARLLPTITDLGVVTTLSMLSSLFSAFSSLAIPSAITKYIAEYRGKGCANVAKGVCKIGLKVGIVAAFLSFFVCFTFASFLAQFFLGDSSRAYIIMLLAVDVFAVVLVDFLGSVLYGFQDFRRYLLLYLFSAPFRLVVTITLLFKGMAIVGILIGWIVGDYSFLVLVGYRIYSLSMKTISSDFALKPLTDYSIPLYGSAILNYLASTIDRYLVLGLAGPSVLGIYSPAATAAGTLSIVSGSLNAALFPQLASMYGRHGKEMLRDVSKAACRYVGLIYLPLAFGLAVTAFPTIALFVGERYTPGAHALALIALASAFTCFGAVFSSILLSVGETRIFFISGCVAIIVDGLLCVLFVGSLGSTGAAIARAFLILVSFIVPALRLRSVMGLNIDFKAYLNSLISSSVMAGVVLSAEVLLANKYALPLYILLGGAVYIIMLRFLRVLNQNDMTILGQFLPFKIGTCRFLARILISK